MSCGSLEAGGGLRGRVRRFPIRPLPPLLPALREDAGTPDGSRFESAGTGGFLPPPKQPETIPQTLPPTSSTLKSQIPTWTGSRRQQRSSVGLGQAAATERSVNRSGPLAVRDPRHRRPRSRSAGPRRDMLLGVPGGFDLPRPAGAAGPVCRARCFSAAGAGSSRLRRGSALAKLSMNVNRTVGSPLGQPALPAGDRHGGRLHPVAPGNSDPLSLHGITSLPLGTTSASFRKSPGGVDASPRRRAPEPRLSPAACALPEPARLAPSGACFASGSARAAVPHSPRFAARRASPCVRLQSSFRFRMPWISDFGSVLFRLAPTFESGQVKLPSALLKAGRTSNLTASPNGTATAWPSATMFMATWFLRTQARTACRRADRPLPRRPNRIPCR